MSSWKLFWFFFALKILTLNAEVNAFLGKPLNEITPSSHQSPIDADTIMANLQKYPLQDIQLPSLSPLILPIPQSLGDPDWANLARYAASDAELSKLPAGSNQVIFMGDSITDGWNISHWFPDKPYVNRGIGGQITPQMLVRFREDVVNLQPNVTVILGGTNDIALQTNLTTIQANLQTMAEVSKVHGFKPIIASITPVCGPVVAVRPPEQINFMNAWIQHFCEKWGFIYLDYFSSLVGADGLLRQELTNDCLHPNAAGYDVMASLAQAAINQALGE